MSQPSDEGPFFHGTKADLRAGDLLTAGFRSNFRPEITMNHVYFTALVEGAGLAAELAARDGGFPRRHRVPASGAAAAISPEPHVSEHWEP